MRFLKAWAFRLKCLAWGDVAKAAAELEQALAQVSAQKRALVSALEDVKLTCNKQVMQYVNTLASVVVQQDGDVIIPEDIYDAVVQSSTCVLVIRHDPERRAVVVCLEAVPSQGEHCDCGEEQVEE